MSLITTPGHPLPGRVAFKPTLWAVLLVICLLSVGCKGSISSQTSAFIKNGKKFIASKDYSRAILELKNAVALTPNSAEAFQQLGIAYAGSGDVLSAAISFLKSTEIDPSNKEAQIMLSTLYANSGDPELHKQAESRVKEVLARDPNNPNALNVLALTELQLGNKESAEKLLEKAINQLSDLNASMALAMIKLREKNLPEAEAILTKATEQLPKSPEAQIALGRFYVLTNRLPEAEQRFQKAIDLDPKQTEARFDLGMVLTGRNEIAAADKVFATLAGSGDARYKTVHALFLFQTGQKQAAITELMKLSQAEPKNRDPRTLLVQAYLQLGRNAEAQKVLDAALKANPKDVDALQQRAWLLLEAGEAASAQQDLSQVLRLNPNSGIARYLMARSYLAVGSPALYTQDLGEAIRVDPNMLQARVELSAQLRGSPGGGKAALDLLNATPEFQKTAQTYLEERNWALLAVGDQASARLGVDGGLKQGKSVTLLLQDANLKLRQKQVAAARQVLQEAMKLDPDDLRATSALASTYLQEKQLLKAVSVVQEQAQRNAKSARAQLLLGAWQEATGDTEAAKKAYATAEGLDPQLLAARVSEARVMANTGAEDAAMKSLLEVAPGQRTADVLLTLGVLEDRKKNLPPALDYYRQVLGLNPDNIQALNNLAWHLVEEGNQPDEGLKLAQHAQEVAPNDPEASDTLGWALYKKGLYSAALGYFEKSASASPLPVHRYHLAMAYLKTGNLAKGDAVYKLALAQSPTLPEAAQTQRVRAELLQ